MFYAQCIDYGQRKHIPTIYNTKYYRLKKIFRADTAALFASDFLVTHIEIKKKDFANLNIVLKFNQTHKINVTDYKFVNQPHSVWGSPKIDW